ncbi:hypothetical protein RIF29_29907 [Crotalaria pallida]|uniref:Uncharacterized protein n=1 Tax=Crotalaria pallida TaxID=3830 RepID=A0AAN9EFC7_CROPI
MWTTHADFKNIVKAIWNIQIDGSKMYQICRRLYLLRKPLYTLNKLCYSHIDKKELDTREKIDDLQKQLDLNPHDLALQNTEKIICSGK